MLFCLKCGEWLTSETKLTHRCETTKGEQARADASHACDACGGTSRIIVPIRPQDNKGNPYTTAACPVCLGAGRISDRMPAKDALADAETLRLYLGDPIHGSEGRLGVITRYACVVEAETYGMASPHTAAHAAFRAVPGLRGEE